MPQLCAPVRSTFVHVCCCSKPLGRKPSSHSLQVPEDSFAFLVDADFVLVKDFAAKLKTGAPGALLRYAAAAWEERSERHAVIVPAFQREFEEEGAVHPQHACAPSIEEIQSDSECWAYNQYDVPLTKAALHRMLEDGSVTGFYEAKVCRQHNRMYSEAYQTPYTLLHT